MKSRIARYSGFEYLVTEIDAKHVVRAFELFATVSTADNGIWVGMGRENWIRNTVLLLLSLETGIDESLLIGAVDLAKRLINRDPVQWDRWAANTTRSTYEG